MNDRQVQAQETKNRILQTVKELLKTKSFDEIKIRDICQKAHVSVGTFYVYFTKKEEALLLVYRELDQAFDALELCGKPYENIQVILTTYYHMASIENLNYNIAIYQSHLVYYDAYFFSEERSLFRLLCGEIQKICGEGKKLHGSFWKCAEVIFIISAFIRNKFHTGGSKRLSRPWIIFNS